MSCRLTILSSGSAGNCAFLETETTRLLIDAGLSGKQIEERLGSIGKEPTQIHAILVTHEHADHIQGLRVLAARHHIPVYANRQTRAAVIESFSSLGTTGAPASRASAFAWRIFETGQRFVVGDFDIDPFTLPHDASDPVGFHICHGNRGVVFLTDLGHITRLAIDKSRQADVLILETNHDLKLLQDDPRRPWSVKQRISGRHGHLSNEAAATALGEIMSDRLGHIYLAHLSQDCNRPELAESTIRKKLDDLGVGHTRVTLTHQQKPCPTETLDSARPLHVETPSLFSQPLQAGFPPAAR
ncbi:MAG: MBL fold metallo-hydrolase [Verrucomicrobia bacterium]|nr:MBL fold metallo-hydrolase [Verrucomicrobiota bacterium]